MKFLIVKNRFFPAMGSIPLPDPTAGERNSGLPPRALPGAKDAGQGGGPRDFWMRCVPAAPHALDRPGPGDAQVPTGSLLKMLCNSLDGEHRYNILVPVVCFHIRQDVVS